VRHPKPTQEQRFLFDLLKGESPAHLNGLDTDKLFDLFRRHRLFPLARHILGLLPVEKKPIWVKAINTGHHRTLRFTGLLQELTEQLRQEGIQVISLKGPLLAHALYGDLGQRHMRDLDLLVIDGEILKGVEALKAAGYQLYIPKRDLKEHQWRYYFRHQYDVAMIAHQPQTIVELHAGIAYPGLLNNEGLLIAELQEFDIAGSSLQCMSRENTFLYLALHGAHHLFFRLFWLRDLAEAMRIWELDYKAIFVRAQELGIERMVGVSLRLAEYYFGVQPPEEWQAFLSDQDSLLKRLENRCHRIILHPDFLSRQNRLNVLLFTMAMKSGLKHKWTSLATVYHRRYIRKFLI